MQFIPYPLFNNLYSWGYTDYLEDRISGKKYKFNVWFFLFNIFWLAHHRMYSHIAVLTLTLMIPTYALVIFTNSGGSVGSIQFFGLVLALGYILLGFFAYDFYHKHCLNKIDYTKNNPLEKLKPSYFIGIPIGIVVFLLTALAASYSMVFFADVLSYFGYNTTLNLDLNKFPKIK